MGYECDIGLGSPEGDDCRHIELGPASGRPPADLVNSGPGNTQFLGYSKLVYSSFRGRGSGWKNLSRLSLESRASDLANGVPLTLQKPAS